QSGRVKPAAPAVMSRPVERAAVHAKNSSRAHQRCRCTVAARAYAADPAARAYGCAASCANVLSKAVAAAGFFALASAGSGRALAPPGCHAKAYLTRAHRADRS